MPAACRSSCRTACSASWSIAACRGTNRENWRQVARATAAHSTVDVQRHVVVPLPGSRLVQALASARRSSAGRATSRCTREDRPDSVMLHASHDGYADRFGVVHHRALKLMADGKRIDGEDVFIRRHGRHCRDRPRRIRGALSSASVGQGQPAERRPRRHADAAEPRGLDLQRLRGPGRDRGERLSRRPRRAAPHVQIVIYGRARKIPRVHWSFAHDDTRAHGRRPLLDSDEPRIAADWTQSRR